MSRAIATNVLISSSALARDRSLSGSISGTMPYFAGLNIVECSAIRNSTTSISSMRVEKKAASPSVITPISNTFTETITDRLLNRSAKWPEYPENKKNGMTNTAPASDRYMLPDPVFAATWTARIETIILYRLSFSAPRNWVQRKHWNPVFFRSSLNPPVCFMPR